MPALNQCNDHAKVPVAIDDKAPHYLVYTPISRSRLTKPLLSCCILQVMHRAVEELFNKGALILLPAEGNTYKVFMLKLQI